MIAGIDLGTTHSLAGVMEDGFPLLVAGEDGGRLTPSVVFFPSGGGEPVAGAAALGGGDGTVVRSVKRLMGLRGGDRFFEMGNEVVAGEGGALGVGIEGRVWLPEEISAVILGKLKADLARACGREVERAVITVPAYFNDAQRAATRRAGELAGFQVERIVAEPTAAALAYGLERLGGRARVAVYDLGGGTFDVSVLELGGGIFEVMATNGDTRLGGDDLDAALAEAWGVGVGEASAIKRVLSGVEECELGGRLWRRGELEEICLPVVRRTREHCLRSLADAGLDAGDLNAVVLVGGATRMPLVRRFVGEVFGREPDVSQHPDEAVAAGATIHAGVLSGAVGNVTLLDVTPLSLGIETFGGLMNVIIPRNTTIPCKAGEMFTNAMANQESMRVTVLQGEREMAADNWRLGSVDVAFPPAPKGRARVGVQFELDADGILHVLARDTATGTDTVLEIGSAVDVGDEAVERMIGESVEHAVEDMGERVFREAVMKADEMLPAVDNALAQLGDEVEGGVVEEVRELVAEVARARAARDTGGLKKALEELDRLTEPLAAALVEKLMG